MTSPEHRAMRVLMVPGLGLGTESWTPLLDSLEESGRLDGALTTTALVSGYGHPRGLDDSLAPDVLARGILDRGDVGPASLVIALSAGCQVAVRIARRAPDGVIGLVLIGPTTDPRAVTWPRLMHRWLRTARFEPLHQIPVLLRQYWRTGPSTMVRAMNQARRDRIDADLPHVNCPVLIIRGAHDHISPEDWTQTLERLLETSSEVTPIRESVTLSSGAHIIPYTHADAVARIIIDFLPQVRPQRDG